MSFETKSQWTIFSLIEGVPSIHNGGFRFLRMIRNVVKKSSSNLIYIVEKK